MKCFIKRMLCLLTAAVLFAACGQAEPGETEPVQASENRMKEVSEAGTKAEAELEDFSMPKPEKLDGGDFANVEKAKERLGYEFTPLEKFSNGYEFRWLTVSDDILILTYQSADKKIDITIMPFVETEEDGLDEFQKKRMLPPMEMSGVEVRIRLYIHYLLPLNWEELITPEDREILYSDWAGDGTSSGITKITRQDFYTFMWHQGGQKYEMVCEAIGEDAVVLTREELEDLVAEWIAANAETEEAEE